MRFLSVRSAANSVKILAAGTLLAAGTAGFVLSDAKAADSWTAVTAADAQFQCVSDNCNAGGWGYVTRGTIVVADIHAAAGNTQPKVGTWQRTLDISCKNPNNKQGFVVTYRGEVKDANWTGQWEVRKTWMGQNIDDTNFPTC